MSPDPQDARFDGALSTDLVRELLQSDFWVRVEGGGPTGSTNDDARALALAGAPEGTVTLASAQNAGRGRFGRVWASPEGGVYLSAVLRPESLAETGPLPLVIGLGVARGIERLGVDTRLKWPNDVLLDGRKLAGVLVESRSAGTETAWVIAGIGVNVYRPRTTGTETVQEAAEGAAYLEDVLAAPARVAVAAAVLDGIAHAYRRSVAGGFSDVRADYLARSSTVGADVVVSDSGGRPCARGRATDIDEAGRLVVQTRDGFAALASGEVTLQNLLDLADGQH